MPEEGESMSYFLIKDVPHYGQFRDVADPSLRCVCCMPTTFKMGAEFVSGRSLPSIDQLYNEVLVAERRMVESGAITEKAFAKGVVHDAMIAVGRNYGTYSYKQEFRSLESTSSLAESPFSEKMYLQGINKIRSCIRGGRPVLVSVYRNMDPRHGTLHPVLLVGFQEGRGFYYHDSDGEEERPRREIFVQEEVFRNCWGKRRLAIFFER